MPPLVVKTNRRRADAAGTRVDLDAEPVGLRLDALQVGVAQVFVDVQVREQDRVDALLGGVVQELRGLPAHRPDGEVVEAQLQVAPSALLAEKLVAKERAAPGKRGIRRAQKR